MVERKVRKMFPGGNTSQGFYSFYQYIISRDDANRIFILKGGPGAGKSDFMKKIAREMIRIGFNIELHYCSSDRDSLDALVIEDLKVALLDGTSPHIVDPEHPGAVDEIINLGDFWNTRALERHKKDIIIHSKHKNEHFIRAYRMLAAAKLVMDDTEEKYKYCMDYAKVNFAAKEWADEIFDPLPIASMPGKERHLFASAYTPAGFIDYSYTLVTTAKKLYHIQGHPGTGKTYLLKKLTRDAVEKGLKVECFHSPLKPNKIHTIVFKELGVTISCNDGARDKAVKSVNFNSFLDKEKLKENKVLIKRNGELYGKLIAEAISAIYDAKKTHDLLEEYYIDNMDFKAVDRLRDAIIGRILEYR